MKLKLIIPILFLSIILTPVRAEEGLWIPMLLQKYNIDIMQKQGLRLSAEDIYSINQASLKDAIVIFGRGCTGDLISENGLLLTNHHCGFDAVQSHSSVDKDYITNGFWARNLDEELPNPSLKVTFLIRIEDVTNEILKDIIPGISEEFRDSVIRTHIKSLEKKPLENSSYKALIKPFFYGNEYYMFIYQEYTDVRLVGTPPNGIGNYGEDLDNWVWPRHTGDFSLFRIYAGNDNEPAPYSPDNRPFKSRKHLSISAAGFKDGDFTMVMGYPGTTTQYVISDEISYMLNTSLPKKVAIRDTRLEIMGDYMKRNDTTRIMYASKYRSISNAWKKWQGIIVGLKQTDAIEQKQKIENAFQEWTNLSPENFALYGDVLSKLKNTNATLIKYSLSYEYSQENVMATELMNFAVDCNSFFSSSMNLSKAEKLIAVAKFKNSVGGFFNDYNKHIDEQIFAQLLRSYYNDIDKEFHPDFFSGIQNKYNGDYEKFASMVFEKSVLSNKNSILELLDQFPGNSRSTYKRFLKDPVINIFFSYSRVYSAQIIPYFDKTYSEMQVLYRTYIRGLREMQKDKVFYPDANFTMRVAFGKIEGYNPLDAVEYDYETNLSGVMEKYRSDTVNYSVPPALIELYNNKDYGKWVGGDGEMPVCFTASNHTSGGNSGSPVLNASGQIIGLNFDRNWEGTMSDLYYDVSICRNIAVDIRYILFIIDKYAGAGYLIDEMDVHFD